jgi:hypothetical protein
MSLVRVRESGQVMLRSEFAKSLPNVSLAETLTSHEFDTYGFDVVAEVPQPVAGEFEKVNYLGAVEQADGSFAQGWEVVAMEQSEIDAIVARKADQARQEAKHARAQLVEEIKVEVGGKVFDGDETSQNRMARAIIALDSAAQASTFWTLADNSTVEVTTDELKLALQLAGQAQTDIWAI